ncbi:MAG: hypothetical protein RLZZ621_2195, partial [Gemmatimonadota bacterium]
DAAALRGALASTRNSASPTKTESQQPWTLLFDGRSLAGWHNYETPGEPVRGWSVEDGLLVRSGPGGDLTTDSMYQNFEFELEWRVPPRGNSGVIYRVAPNMPATYLSGPEMQILDDAGHRDGRNALTSAGSNYGLHAPLPGHVKGANEWNSARLIVNGTHVEHWLNGARVVTYELGSPDWDARRRASKFENTDTYGRATRGYLVLQDHGDRVAFRNVRIRELP